MQSHYVQVLLVNKDTRFRVAWIDSTFAHKGQHVRLMEDKIREEGWVVKETYCQASRDFVETHERDFRLLPTALE